MHPQLQRGSAPIYLLAQAAVCRLALPVVAGLAAGIATARAASQMLTVLVYRLSPTDPGVLAGLRLHHRACGGDRTRRLAGRSRVDPNLSLRAELTVAHRRSETSLRVFRHRR